MLFLISLVAVGAPINNNNNNSSSSSSVKLTAASNYLPNIVELAEATPDLSTLVAALEAASLTTTLSGQGPFTVFAPSNEAFAKLPPTYLKLLLDPANTMTLRLLLEYHVVIGTEAFSRDLKNGQQIKTAEGENVTVGITGRDISINDAKVTTADVSASNGVVHLINKVLMPSALPPMPGPSPPSGNHLWFRGFTKARDNQYICGEVDAAPRIPDALFDPRNAATLHEYIQITLALFGSSPEGGEKLFLELGRCAEKKYTQNACYQGCPSVDWAPVQLMERICPFKCQCNFRGQGPNSQLPECRNEPDVPSLGKWCSLCGPKYNDPITVPLFDCLPYGQTCPGPDQQAGDASRNHSEFFAKEFERLLS